jgi:hypothetical protein
MSRALLAWSVIGLLGVVCIVIGVGKGAVSGTAGFEALKFAIAGAILLAIAIYKVVRTSRRR